MKKVLSIALSTAVVASTLLTGCGGSNGGSAETISTWQRMRPLQTAEGLRARQRVALRQVAMR